MAKDENTPELYTKEQVIRIVAKFSQSYNTEAFSSTDGTLEQAIEEVKDLIEFDV